MVRAITTNVEGTIGFTSFFMRAVRRSKGKVGIPQSVKGESVPERLVRVLNAFSHAFGNDTELYQDDTWKALGTTFEIRDRLTHPKCAFDVELTMDDLGEPLTALGWLNDKGLSAVLLDLDKTADCYGSQRG
jgi:hypothetical protein